LYLLNKKEALPVAGNATGPDVAKDLHHASTIPYQHNRNDLPIFAVEYRALPRTPYVPTLCPYATPDGGYFSGSLPQHVRGAVFLCADRQ